MLPDHPFIKDTHYRNLFETTTGNNTLYLADRREWEDRTFDKVYSNSTDFERVKYGVSFIERMVAY
jgi:hypothetical protein